MQIDLFKDPDIVSAYVRLGTQIFTRKLKFTRSLEELEKMPYTNKEFVDFKNKIWEQAEKVQNFNEEVDTLPNKRKGFTIGDGSFDILAESELLGISQYGKGNTVVIDFSDKLDFVLAVLTGCNPDNIRQMPYYHEISKSLLNYELDNIANLGFDLLFNLDVNLDLWFTALIQKYNNNVTRESVIEDTHKVLYDFYCQLMTQATTIENYTAAAFKEFSEGECVYRSKTFSKVILSSDTKIDEDITLVHGDYSTKVHVKSYLPFEYPRELGEMSNEFSR